MEKSENIWFENTFDSKAHIWCNKNLIRQHDWSENNMCFSKYLIRNDIWLRKPGNYFVSFMWLFLFCFYVHTSQPGQRVEGTIKFQKILKKYQKNHPNISGIRRKTSGNVRDTFEHVRNTSEHLQNTSGISENVLICASLRPVVPLFDA